MKNDFDGLTVVIPVREGSSRIKKKVLLPFGPAQESLLAWKVKQLKKVIGAKQIFVSTESERLKEEAKKLKVQIHNRQPFLADGHKASFSQVITGIVAEIPAEHIAWVTVVVPLMMPAEYEQGFKMYYEHVVKNKKCDSLFSSYLLKEYLWDDKKSMNYRADKNHTISQDLPNIHKVTNALYMRNKASILKEGYFLGRDPYKFRVGFLSSIDIDVPDDYEVANALTGLYLKKTRKKYVPLS